MILHLHHQVSPTRISELVGQSRNTVYRWFNRWQARVAELIELEEAGALNPVLEERLSEVLGDATRSGAPPTYSIEQNTQIVALACESPKDSGRPISYWTMRELADEAQKRQIVTKISPGTVHSMLNEADLKPHRWRYWLNHKPENPDLFAEQARAVCGVYHQAQEFYAQGTHVGSVDEKTGIQALKRIHPDHPMRPGKPQLLEFEYERNGTQCLLATFEVATGKVLGSVTDSRSEAEFLAHIIRTIDTDPEGGWIFVADQLDTHKSESLVRLVAERCGIEEDLGVKGKSGILRTRHTRADFLSDPQHRIRFVYTPKHASWLNQVEIWFSILVRKLLRRSSFASTEQLRTRILEFIDYFNKTMAKPFKWTYKGRVLQGA